MASSRWTLVISCSPTFFQYIQPQQQEKRGRRVAVTATASSPHVAMTAKDIMQNFRSSVNNQSVPSDLNDILGELTELEHQLDVEQNDVIHTLKRRPRAILTSQSSPSRYAASALSLADYSGSSPTHRSKTNGFTPISKSSDSVSYRARVDSSSSAQSSPSKWASNIDAQLQRALCELNCIVASPQHVARAGTIRSENQRTQSPSLIDQHRQMSPRQQARKTSAFVSDDCINDKCNGNLSTDAVAVAAAADRRQQLMRNAGHCGDGGSGSIASDSVSQRSPVRRCLKPQQRVPPEWSSTEAAADERAGKAEMMQRFIEVTLQQQQVNAASPETDSAFCSDNISLPSSGSRASVMTNSSQGSAGSGGKDQTDKGRDKEQANGKQIERTVRFSSEAPQMVTDYSEGKKVPILVYLPEGAVSTVHVSEMMTTAHVCSMLLSLNRMQPSLLWCLVESLPDLYMERMLEDHDYPLDCISLWSRDSTNRLYFVERPIKYDLFLRPECYLLTNQRAMTSYDAAERRQIISEFFDDGIQRLPEVDGMLYIKCQGKKAWRKLYFVLRASGIYYNPKGKSKNSKELVCLQSLEFVELFIGVGWKKKYKAPSDYGFALKNPQVQKKLPKFIKYLCAEDHTTFNQWVTGIRIAKQGKQLKMNFDNAKTEILEWSREKETTSPRERAESYSMTSIETRRKSYPKECAVKPLSPSPTRKASILSSRDHIPIIPQAAREPDFPDATTVFCKINRNGDRPTSSGFRGRVSSFSGYVGDNNYDASLSSTFCTPSQLPPPSRLQEISNYGLETFAFESTATAATTRRSSQRKMDGNARGLVGRSESCTPTSRNRNPPPPPPIRSHRTSLTSLAGTQDDDNVMDSYEYSTATIRPFLHRHSSLTPLTIETDFGYGDNNKNSDFPPPPSPSTLQLQQLQQSYKDTPPLDTAPRKANDGVIASDGRSSSKLPQSHPPVSSGYLRLHRRTASGPIYPILPQPGDQVTMIPQQDSKMISYAPSTSSTMKPPELQQQGKLPLTKTKMSSACQTDKTKPPVPFSNGHGIDRKASFQGGKNNSPLHASNTQEPCNVTLSPQRKTASYIDVNQAESNKNVTTMTQNQYASGYEINASKNVEHCIINTNNGDKMSKFLTSSKVTELSPSRRQLSTFENPDCVPKQVRSMSITSGNEDQKYMHDVKQKYSNDVNEDREQRSNSSSAFKAELIQKLSNVPPTKSPLSPRRNVTDTLQNRQLSDSKQKSGYVTVQRQETELSNQMTPARKVPPPVIAPKPTIKPKPISDSPNQPKVDVGCSDNRTTPTRKPPPPPKRHQETQVTQSS